MVAVVVETESLGSTKVYNFLVAPHLGLRALELH